MSSTKPTKVSVLSKLEEVQVADFLTTFLKQIGLDSNLFQIPFILFLWIIFLVLTFLCISRIETFDRKQLKKAEDKKKKALQEAVEKWEQQEIVNKWTKERDLSKQADAVNEVLEVEDL